MSYTVEKRYIVNVDRDEKPIYRKEVVENLVDVSIGMIDLHVEKGLDRIRIKKLDDFGQTIKEKNYYIGEVYTANSIYKGSKVYDVLFNYYKRDPSLVLDRDDVIVLTTAGTFNIVSKDDIVHEGTKTIDIKEIGANNKYQKDGLEPM